MNFTFESKGNLILIEVMVEIILVAQFLIVMITKKNTL